jgi:hypothetical protein
MATFRLAMSLCLGLLVVASAAASKSGIQSQLSTAGQARENALETAWEAELEVHEKKVSPIKRVVALLKKMKAELEAEAAKEADMYDKMVCWCQTNEKEKTKAIADAEALDGELSSEIESRAAKFGEASTEIVRLKKQIAEDTAALKEATAIREKQAASFSDTEKELMQCITNVKNAIEVLSKHNSASFAQMDAPVVSSMRAVLRDLAFKHEMILADAGERGQKVSLLAVTAQTGTSAMGNSLLSALDAEGAPAASGLPLDIAQRILERSAKEAAPSAAGFLQAGAAPTSGSYAPQSGQIFGILKTLKEDFENNLSQDQKEEMKAQEDFKNLSKAKTAQIASGKEKLDATEGQHADNQKALSDAKENLEMTREQRSKDVEFLRNLKVTCGDLDKQWEQRSKTRATETVAVSEAISIITADDNMDLLRNTVSLLQVDDNMEEGTEMRMRRNKVVASLRKAAQEPFFATNDLMDAWHSRTGNIVSGSPRTQLSTLAVTVSLDSFTKIKKAMDKMTADLKEEQAAEVKFKAHCDKELDATEQNTFKKNEEREDLENDISRLAKMMSKLSEDIAAAKTQTAETEVAIKKASQVREGENSEFQTVVADQRATQTILSKALGKLQEFYKKAALVQQKSQQEPPVKFNAYSKNAGASPVIGMIEQIIEDSKALESEAVAGETEAQKAYELFVKDSNDLIAELAASISSKTKANATARQNSETAKGDLDSTMGELEALSKYEADLHSDCDFVRKNFEIRQKARMDEMEAIQSAKAILSGMK